MRKTYMLVAALMLAGSFNAVAADEEILPGMAKKLGYGLLDTVTGIVELPVQIVKGYDNGFGPIKNETGSKVVGTILGFFRGIGHTVGRTAHGVINVATFWAANRESNHGIGIPLDDTYAWEKGTRYSIMKPNLKEGLMPYPRKLGYGLADGFLGLVDIPAQIAVGARSDNPATGVPVGIVRGLWYGVSRSIAGFGDAILFIVPNPAETYGYSYSGNLPWDGFFEDQAKETPKKK